MNKYIVYLMLLGTALMWSTTYVGSKMVISFVPPTVAGAIRWGLAGLILLFVFFSRQRKMPNKKDWLWLFILAFVGVTLYHYLFFIGLSYTKSSDATMILSVIHPSFTALCAVLLLKERLTHKQILGFLLVLLGTSFFFSILNQGGIFDSERLLGNAILLSTACCAATYALLGKRLMEKLGSVTVTCIVICLGSVMLLILALPDFQQVQWKQIGWDFWLTQLFLALFTSALANLLYFKLIQTIGAVSAASINYLVPVFGLFLSSILLNDTVTKIQIVGAVIMIIGIWQIQQRPN